MRRHRVVAGATLALAATLACDDDPASSLTVAAAGGSGQVDTVGRALATPYSVFVTDPGGAPAAGIVVTWTVVSGGGSIGAISPTNAAGIGTAIHTLGTAAGPQAVRAAVSGATGSPVTFTSTALAAAPATLVKAAGDAQTAGTGQSLAVPLGVLARDAYGNPTRDWAVAWARVAGSGTLAASQTMTDATGIARVGYTLGTAGTDTITAALVSGALGPVRFTATAVAQLTLVAQVAIPANYGIHDTFVRDGLAFVSAWDTGIRIFDVGNGMSGGSPSSPQIVSPTTPVNNAHNAWWFHNPNTSDKKYLFVGEEGPGSVGSSSSGDVHVLDVSNLAAPVEVASYRMSGAGTHNFWMDEQAEILYAAYYDGGVVALDVSGTLAGDLAARELWRLQPGGAGNTYTWGVQLHNGSLYATDMLSGFWQLRATAPPGVLAGGNNVLERYGSDLWVHGGYAYTGTWGFRNASGNAVKIWRLDAGGAPVLADSIIVAGIGTVSDIEVSPDGKLLMFSAEGGGEAGLHLYGLTDPARPTFVARALVSTGLHTATFGTIGSRLYAFAAKNPSSPALMIYDVTGLAP